MIRCDKSSRGVWNQPAWVHVMVYFLQLCKLWASCFSLLKSLILSVKQRSENYFSLSGALNIKWCNACKGLALCLAYRNPLLIHVVDWILGPWAWKPDSWSFPNRVFPGIACRGFFSKYHSFERSGAQSFCHSRRDFLWGCCAPYGLNS